MCIARRFLFPLVGVKKAEYPDGYTLVCANFSGYSALRHFPTDPVGCGKFPCSRLRSSQHLSRCCDCYDELPTAVRIPIVGIKKVMYPNGYSLVSADFSGYSAFRFFSECPRHFPKKLLIRDTTVQSASHIGCLYEPLGSSFKQSTLSHANKKDIHRMSFVWWVMDTLHFAFFGLPLALAEKIAHSRYDSPFCFA